MPIAVLQILEGRDVHTKAQLIGAVTEAIHLTLDAPMATIRVLVTEVPAAQWGIAGETVQAKREREAAAPPSAA